MIVEYEVLVIEPRMLSGERKGQIKKIKADGNYLSNKLQVGNVFHLMGGEYQIGQVIKKKEWIMFGKNFLICNHCNGVFLPENTYRTGHPKYPIACKHCLKKIGIIKKKEW